MKKIILNTLVGAMFTSYGMDKAQASSFSHFTQQECMQNTSTSQSMLQPLINNACLIFSTAQLTYFVGKKIYNYMYPPTNKKVFGTTQKELNTFKTTISQSIYKVYKDNLNIKKEYQKLTNEDAVLNQLTKILTPADLECIQTLDQETHDKLTNKIIENFSKSISDIKDGITPTNPNDQSNKENIHLLIDELAQLIGKFFPNKVSLQGYQGNFSRYYTENDKKLKIEQVDCLTKYISENQPNIIETILKNNKNKNKSSVSNLLDGCFSRLQQFGHEVLYPTNYYPYIDPSPTL
jgi:vesicle coat complex subunit